MRVVSYVRMSTGRQDLSPGQQRAAITAHAKKSGYTVAREYADLGVSGDKTEKRKGFQQMIADGAARKFDRIVVYDRSRFGRFDSIEFGRWVAPLRDAGVELETLDGGVEDWSDFGGRVLGLVAQEAKHQFLVDLSRGVVRGQTAKAVENRGYAGPTPFGYQRRTIVDGRKHISTLTVHEARAAIVRDIFTMYAAPDGSLNGVAATLNARGVPAIRGGQRWRPNALRRILGNEVYMGDTVWGRRQKGRYHTRQGTDVIRQKRRGPVVFVEPIRHRDTVPAIVSRELFAKVQKLLAQRTHTTRSAAAIRPLSGLVCCEQCGRPMHAENGLLRCQSSHPSIEPKRRCPAVRVPAAPLLDAVLTGLRARFTAPAARARLRAAIERQAARRSAGAGDDQASMSARHRALEVEIATGLERIPLMPAGLVADYAAALDRKAAERDALAAQLAAKAATIPARPKMAARAAMAHLDELVAAATTNGSPAAVNAALRALGVKVSVPPAKLPSDAEITVGDCSTTVSRCEQVPRMTWRQRIA
jgi:DNA invertase Pin-like site-specific DNA recombinase